MVKVRLYIRLSTGVNSSVVMDLAMTKNILEVFLQIASTLFGLEISGKNYLFIVIFILTRLSFLQCCF